MQGSGRQVWDGIVEVRDAIVAATLGGDVGCCFLGADAGGGVGVLFVMVVGG